MLQIYFGDVPERVASFDDVVYNAPLYFKNAFRPAWLDDQLTCDMLQSIDQIGVVEGRLIDAEGRQIEPARLSAGAQLLLLLRHVPHKVFDISACSDACAWWILQIAAARSVADGGDVTVCLRNLMHFGDGQYSIRVLNTGVVVHDNRGLLREASAGLRGAHASGLAASRRTIGDRRR